MKLAAGLAVAIALAAGPAAAQGGIIGGGVHHSTGGGGRPKPGDPRDSYTGPLDVMWPRPAAWFGLRAATSNIASAHAQPLIDIRSLATNETRTIIVEMSGSFGSVAAFCAGGCAVTEIFDQLGGSPRTWPTAAEQPTLSLSCSDGKPCLTGGGVEFAEGAALPDFASPPTATASYIVFEQEWQCEARSQAQCAALRCDGVATRLWWRCLGLADGRVGLQIEFSGPFSAGTGNAVSLGLVGLNFIEQRTAIPAEEIAPLLPKVGG